MLEREGLRDGFGRIGCGWRVVVYRLAPRVRNQAVRLRQQPWTQRVCESCRPCSLERQMEARDQAMLLAERLASDRTLRGQAFNFSNESQISVLEMVDLILRKMKSPLRPEILNQASNEIRHQFLSAERARRVLGWRPEFTLDTGLDRTLAWYREFLGAPAAMAQAGRG